MEGTSPSRGPENGAGTLTPSWCDPEFNAMHPQGQGVSLLGKGLQGPSTGQRYREGWLLNGSNVHLPCTVERK